MNWSRWTGRCEVLWETEFTSSLSELATVTLIIFAYFAFVKFKFCLTYFCFVLNRQNCQSSRF
jgi:hypothetical protein